MGKQIRSPLLGYNHNVRYHGRIFHVQTEDSGPSNPHLYTHLFYEGTILATKKHDYESVAPEDTVRSLMQGQHKALMKELKQAFHDERIAEFFAGRGEPEVLEEPETSVPAEGPGASATKALDLDAIAVFGADAVEASRAPVAQPLAGRSEPEAPLPLPATSERRATPGPGVYATRGRVSDRPFDAKTPRNLDVPVPETRPRVGQPGSSPAPPPHVSQRVGGRPIDTPPLASSRPVLRVRTPLPVVVLQPSHARRPGATPRTISRTAPAADGGVVQRNVVIGVGGSAPQPQRPVRPVRVVPYVVGGPQSPIASAPRRTGVTQELPAVGGRAAPGMTPLVARPADPAAPSPPLTDAAESSFRGELDTDRSLDDVILRFLSEENTTYKNKK